MCCVCLCAFSRSIHFGIGLNTHQNMFLKEIFTQFIPSKVLIRRIIMRKMHSQIKCNAKHRTAQHPNNNNNKVANGERERDENFRSQCLRNCVYRRFCGSLSLSFCFLAVRLLYCCVLPGIVSFLLQVTGHKYKTAHLFHALVALAIIQELLKHSAHSMKRSDTQHTQGTAQSVFAIFGRTRCSFRDR